MTESEAIVVIKRKIKGLSSNFMDDDPYADAIDDAERELGFSFPTSVAFQIHWLQRRTIRHLVSYLLLENTESIKFKQINLQFKFQQMRDLVLYEDKEFAKALEESLFEFANVSATQAFGHKIDAGFAYDEDGSDITYDEDSIVIVSPSSVE